MAFTVDYPDAQDLLVMSEIITNIKIAAWSVQTFTSLIITAIRPWVYGLSTIFMLLWGLALMRGAIEAPLKDSYIRIFKFSLVLMMSLSAGGYTNQLTEFLWGAPSDLFLSFSGLDWISSIFSTSTASVSSNGVVMDFADVMMIWVLSHVTTLGQSLTVNGSQGGGSQNDMLGMGLYAFGGGLSALVIAIEMVAKFSLAILLAITPFMFLALLFEKTKTYFESWLNSIVTMILTLLLLDLSLLLLLPLLIKTVYFFMIIADTQGGVLDAKESVQLMVLLGVYIAIIKQIPTTAASITRGFAIGGVDNPAQLARG